MFFSILLAYLFSFSPFYYYYHFFLSFISHPLIKEFCFYLFYVFLDLSKHRVIYSDKLIFIFYCDYNYDGDDDGDGDDDEIATPNICIFDTIDMKLTDLK